MKRVPASISVPFLLGSLGVLLWLERRRPLRQAVEPKLRREGRNAVIAVISAAALQVADRPVIRRISSRVEEHRWGLFQRLSLPKAARVTFAIILMDYTLYLWHVLLHRIPLLWRFHLVHHVDRDLDTSTALRFHFGELVLSVPWRAAQVVTIGVCPLALSIWQVMSLFSVMLHHSNLRFSMAIERWLGWLIVTPRMHGIHHSNLPEETGSNWSSGLTVWDWLHGTLRWNVRQNDIIIGVPAYNDPAEVALSKIIRIPFTEQPASWKFRDGTEPRRRRTVGAPTVMLP